MPDRPSATWTPLPPEEALAVFRRKGYVTSFDWRDVQQEVHAHAFTVAKLTDLSLLADVRVAVDRAIAEGGTLRQFRRELEPTLKARGWWGRQTVRDPKTGEEVAARLGSPRRLATIFDTNLRTAYAAGRWEQIQRTKRLRPYLRYVATLDSRTRPQHRAWHGLVLPADDPFWQTHFPPNGWRCRCNVVQLSERDLKRYGYRVGSAPPVVTQRWDNPRTGDVRRVPVGIDPGFDHNVGIARSAPSERAARAFADKIAELPADVGAASWAVAEAEVVPALTRGFAGWADRLIGSLGVAAPVPELGEVWPVGALSVASLAELRAVGQVPASALLTVKGDDFRHLVRDTKRWRGVAIERSLLRELPALLARRRALLWDTVDPAVLAVVDLPGVAASEAGKVVVRLDFRLRTVDAMTGERVQITVNSVRTAGVVNLADLRGGSRYLVLEGQL